MRVCDACKGTSSDDVSFEYEMMPPIKLPRWSLEGIMYSTELDLCARCYKSVWDHDAIKKIIEGQDE